MKTAAQHEQEWRDHIETLGPGHQHALETICYSVFTSAVAGARETGPHGDLQSVARAVLYGAGKRGAAIPGGYNDIYDSRPSSYNRFRRRLASLDEVWRGDAQSLCDNLRFNGAAKADYDPLIMGRVETSLRIKGYMPNMVSVKIDHPYLSCQFNKFLLAIREDYPENPRIVKEVQVRPGETVDLIANGYTPHKDTSVSLILSNDRRTIFGREVPRSYYRADADAGWMFLWDDDREDEVE